jgi:catechol 2,3-dioxygenase-like lactoylglutathione lyase family enzyme
MLADLEVHPTLPAADMQRVKKFYAEKLGMEPAQEFPDGSVFYQCKGTFFMVYPSQYAGTAQNTAMEFTTTNIERDMQELRAKGVVFEEYDFPDFKTVNGVAAFGDMKAAWFKDSEGNILALGQMG